MDGRAISIAVESEEWERLVRFKRVIVSRRRQLESMPADGGSDRQLTPASRLRQRRPRCGSWLVAGTLKCLTRCEPNHNVRLCPSQRGVAASTALASGSHGRSRPNAAGIPWSQRTTSSETANPPSAKTKQLRGENANGAAAAGARLRSASRPDRFHRVGNPSLRRGTSEDRCPSARPHARRSR